jgi:pyruvate/2-oxoglutarate/acetoin dehydrogenase E1 component
MAVQGAIGPLEMKGAEALVIDLQCMLLIDLDTVCWSIRTTLAVRHDGY